MNNPNNLPFSNGLFVIGHGGVNISKRPIRIKG